MKVFSLEKVSHNPAVFDIQKLQWMNGVYIRDMDIDQLYIRVLAQWQKLAFIKNPSEEEETVEGSTKENCIVVLNY